MNKIYGLRFDPKEPTATARLCDAAGLKYAQETAGNIEYSDFDACYPYSEMKECNLLSDGSVIYRGDLGFSREKNTFIEVPAFYFKRIVTDGVEEWYISGKKHEGFFLEPWFIGENGEKISHRYIAKYEGCDFSEEIVSATGKLPKRGYTIDEFRAAVNARGFSLCSVYAYLAITHLFVIECGTVNSQSINSGVSYAPYSSVGYCLVRESSHSSVAAVSHTPRWDAVEVGTTLYVSEQRGGDLSVSRRLISKEVRGDLLYLTLDGEPLDFIAEITRVYPSAFATGACDGLKYVNGRPSDNEYISSFVYRGIENIYGNTWEFMDGASFSSESLKVSLFGVELSFLSPYNNSLGESGRGFIAELGCDAEKPYATFPSQIGAPAKTHYFSEWSTMVTEGNASIVFGGGWDHFFCNGIFCLRCLGKNAKNWLYGYRAMK
ncbi:MAG: hypothetical protein IKV16_02080 [Clostridia bacterium]|nr:hypothetical protein [Clostridia bacterium]